jgi:hypothetical protein
MNERETLERFLRTGPRDVGCDEAMAVLHVYVDLVAASQDAAARYPGVTVHLAARGPCGDDFAGLPAAVTGEQPGSRAQAWIAVPDPPGPVGVDSPGASELCSR